jgi:hypothetical protein
MKSLFALALFICLFLPIRTHAENWLDRSHEIPTTVLDNYVNIPYFSFAQSRGHDWLAGNPNQLIHVLPETIIDLTPDLLKFGFSNIRRVSTDGSGWIILGDARAWQSRPDLAMYYDGMYFKNISHVIRALPRDEWIGDIAGKQGMWYIATHKNLYAWHSAFDEPIKIKLPDGLLEARVSEPQLFSVEHGWIIVFEQNNHLKSLAVGRKTIEKRFYFFDGQNFSEITDKLGNLSSYSTIGSNGKELFIMGSSITPEQTTYHAYTTNGLIIKNVYNIIASLLPNTISAESQIFANQTKAVWTGSAWFFISPAKQAAIWHPAMNAKLLPTTKDTFLNAGYGKNGVILLTGYSDKQGLHEPKIVQAQF